MSYKKRPVRVDKLLVEIGMAGSRKRARELIEAGVLRVGGKVPKKGDLVYADEPLEVDLPSFVHEPLRPNSVLAPVVLYEDPAMVIVEKRAPLPCHPVDPREETTLMNGVVALYPETARVGSNRLEGGLVHRLDNGVSGAVMVARSDEALKRLRTMLREGEVERIYEALVIGRLTGSVTVDIPIGHHPNDPSRMVLVTGPDVRWRGRLQKAISHIEPIAQSDVCTLVRVIPETGVRHQIRLHLASLGTPVVGDTLYGAPPCTLLEKGRIFLHLRRLDAISPSGSRVQVEATWPDDIVRAYQKLASSSVLDLDNAD